MRGAIQSVPILALYLILELHLVDESHNTQTSLVQESCKDYQDLRDTEIRRK